MADTRINSRIIWPCTTAAVADDPDEIGLAVVVVGPPEWSTRITLTGIFTAVVNNPCTDLTLTNPGVR